MGKILILSCLLSLAICASHKHKWKLCRPDEENKKQCVEDLTQDVMLAFMHGVPEHQLPVLLEPLKIEHASLLHDIKTPPIKFVGEYTNIRMYNLTVCNITKIDFEHHAHEFSYQYHFSNPQIKGFADFNYKDLILDGKNLSCSGQGSWSYDDADVVFGITVKVDHKPHGAVSAQVTNSTLKFLKATLSVNYVSEESPERAEGLNALVKDHAQAIYDGTIQDFAGIYNTAIRNVVNEILSRVPLKL
uniref:Uncharacterized protein n=1 Tax=Photinus pyralis TaxID=7054 RepID=A0A1Y1LND4_PHOPY